MHDLKKGLSYLVFVLLSLTLASQEVTRLHPDTHKRVLSIMGKPVHRIQSDQEITAVAILSEKPSMNHVIVGADSLLIPQDHEAEGFQYFLSIPTPATAIMVSSSDAKAVIYLIHSGSPPEIKKEGNSRVGDACTELPLMILQSEWRAGLTPPNYTRSFHEVYHLIVHHSAGSNTATSYTQVVRDIYLYHTQVNGWSDIGYNFVIAQDGTLYAGRDPDGGDQSLVRGAHFCGANTNTLGVCLLGNYETATPTEETLTTLGDLLTYEVIAQDLEPQGSREHSVGQLNTIAGHRDGCSTLCPGENTYSLLPTIRNQVNDRKANCSGDRLLAFNMDREILGVSQVLTLSNTSRGYLTYSWYIDGSVQESAENQFTFDLPGTYDIGIIGYSTDIQDSLIHQNAIRVSRLEKEPIVFPNPVSSRTITLDYRPAINQVVVKDVFGKKYLQTNGKDAAITLPQSLNPGVYLLEITTESGEVITEKFIVE